MYLIFRLQIQKNYLCYMESTRQKKISRQLQKDLSEIFQLEGKSLLGTSLFQ